MHALQEIRRALASGGILIDLRPLAGEWPVEVESRRESRLACRITDLPLGLTDDEAANQAMQKASENGWFVREREEFFPFYYYWDSPNEMQEYITEEWKDFAVIDETDWRNIRALWSVADADARLRVRLRMLITRWRKAG